MNSFEFNEQRKGPRVRVDYQVQLMIGSQLTLKGLLKDISQKSAFITIRNAIYLQLNDPVGFVIQLSPQDPRDFIQGHARISRIVPGDGLAIYFTKIDESCQKRLTDFFNYGY